MFIDKYSGKRTMVGKDHTSLQGDHILLVRDQNKSKEGRYVLCLVLMHRTEGF